MKFWKRRKTAYISANVVTERVFTTGAVNFEKLLDRAIKIGSFTDVMNQR